MFWPFCDTYYIILLVWILLYSKQKSIMHKKFKSLYLFWVIVHYSPIWLDGYVVNRFLSFNITWGIDYSIQLLINILKYSQ